MRWHYWAIGMENTVAVGFVFPIGLWASLSHNQHAQGQLLQWVGLPLHITVCAAALLVVCTFPTLGGRARGWGNGLA